MRGCLGRWEVFQPEAIVMQCGGDWLSGDMLGRLNLSIDGHARCVGFMRSFDTPLLLLGSGGYTINHVATCWSYEVHIYSDLLPNYILNHSPLYYAIDHQFVLTRF